MEENNKIIAEFMGLNNLKDSKGDAWDYMNTGKSIYTLRTKNLHYESDWNWLMKVVEKIFKDFYKINPCPIYLKINIEKALNEVNIEAVYNACVEFIKWYNQNLEKEK